MADLSQLMQIAPGSAAFMMGQQNASSLATQKSERERLAELIRELQIKNQHSQQMNPLLEQQRDLENQGLRAELPGKHAQSRKHAAEATLKEGTLQSDIAAGNSANDVKMQQDKVKQMHAIGQILYGVGAQAQQQQGPGASHLFISDALKQQGIPDEISKRALEWGPQGMMQYGQQLLKNTEAYVREIDQQGMRDKTDLEKTDRNNRTQLDLEDKRIAAGKYAKKQEAADFEGRVQAELKRASGNPEAQLAILQRAAALSMHMNDREGAMKYQVQADAIEKLVQAKIGAGNAAKPNIPEATKGRIPAMPLPDVRSPNAPTATPPAPGGPGPAGAPSVQKLAIEAWGAFEPNKYEYRINPQTGKLQRKAR